jgi:hypothetical protein
MKTSNDNINDNTKYVQGKMMPRTPYHPVTVVYMAQDVKLKADNIHYKGNWKGWAQFRTI